MTDLTNAADFGVDVENSQRIRDATNVNRWDRKGDRLYINDVRGIEGGYIDLETGGLHEHDFNNADVTVEDGRIVVEYTNREGLMGDRRTVEYRVVITFDGGDGDDNEEADADDETEDVETEPVPTGRENRLDGGETVIYNGERKTVEHHGAIGIEFEAGGSAAAVDCDLVVEDDDTEPEVVADGGTTLTEPLTDTLVSDRLHQHDDPDHKNGNSVEDVYGAFADLQSELGDYIDDYDEYHDVVHEDSALIVYDLGPDKADLSIALDEIGVDDEPLRLVISGLMHDVAEQHTDGGRWSDTYPLVVVKDDCTRRAERRTRRRLGALTQEQNGAARALDYWATKVQGITFEQWSAESGRSTGAIGNSIRRGREDSI